MDTTIKKCSICSEEDDCIQDENGKWVCGECSCKQEPPHKCHWFDDSIDPVTGKERHIHMYGDKRLFGTTTILDVLGKVLTWWASGCAVSEMGWIKKLDTRKSTPEEIEQNMKDRLFSAACWREKVSSMPPEEYLKLLDKAYRAHADSLGKSATKGTDLHASLEKYVKGWMYENSGMSYDEIDKKYGMSDEEIELIHPFIDWSVQNVKKFVEAEKYCWSKIWWVGGKFDVLAELNDGTYAVIDFKSAKEVYFNHLVQVGGYILQLEENGYCEIDGSNEVKLDKPISSIIVFPFGAKKVIPTIRYDVAKFKDAFTQCVQLYKLKENIVTL
jgi:hypothetical protein